MSRIRQRFSIGGWTSAAGAEVGARPAGPPGSAAINRPWCGAFVAIGLALTLADGPLLFAQPGLGTAARQAQAKVVKVYGAGGLAGLKAYQSGFLVSPEGHVATAWSSVLDVDPTVVLDDGRRYEASIVGFEPALELAVLKIDESGLPFFRLETEAAADWGDPVLAISNLFGIATGNEPASVMQGHVAALTRLDARRGTFQTPYQGPVLILDLIANNPGAAGGAVVDVTGRLVGMLGKELRDGDTGAWLNYALPVTVLREVIGDIIAGRQTQLATDDRQPLDRQRAHSRETLGLILVPNVLESTPPFVDATAPGSPARRAGLRPDDLILLLDGRRVEHQRALDESLRYLDRRDPVRLTVRRGNEIVPLSLTPR